MFGVRMRHLALEACYGERLYGCWGQGSNLCEVSAGLGIGVT